MISGCLGGLALIGNILLEGQATTTRDGDKLFSQKCPQNLGKEKITGYSLQIREQKLKNAEIFCLFPCKTEFSLLAISKSLRGTVTCPLSATE